MLNVSSKSLPLLRKLMATGTMFVAVVVLLGFPTSAPAQPFFSYQITAGLANYPLHDLMQQYAGQQYVAITKATYNPFPALSIHRRITWESYVFIGIEYLRTTPKYQYHFSDWYGGNSVHYCCDWSLCAIPVTVGYEKRVDLKRGRLMPFYQCGASLFYSAVRTQGSGNKIPLIDERKRGTGYGLSGAFGLSFPMATHLNGIVRLRARYADGMHFSGNPAGFKTEFSSFDFSAGVEYSY